VTVTNDVGDVGEAKPVVVLLETAVEVEELDESPTLGGPLVEPLRAVTASRYCSSVVPVSPVIVKRSE
jgi:hypothetical protein